MENQRVRRNDWGTLVVPAVGTWEPTASVSVVIPAYRSEATLGFVLAGLAAQTYPAHLLEVVVADDSPEPLTLPELRPERTRVVRTAAGWGRAAACHTGASVADGDIVHWLDADMLVERDEIEAQARWHAAIDHAVVLGHKWFVDPSALAGVSSEEVRDAVARGEVAAYFHDQERVGHDWVEEIYARTDQLRTAGPRAHRAHVGASASLRRALYLDAGGMDIALKLGEDNELGYRLSEAGAVFVPDEEARAWHLGPTHVMRRQDEVNDYNFPFLADRIPDGRVKRAVRGRQYAVPYVEVVLDATDLGHAEVIGCVEAVLASSVPDLEVTVIGPFDELTDERVPVLDDPLRSVRAIHAAFVHDSRVSLVTAMPSAGPGQQGRSPAMLRLVLPGASYAPGRQAIQRLVRELEWTHHGLRLALLPDGAVVRLERTSAYARARRVAGPGEDLDAIVDALYGSWWVDGREHGFVPVEEAVVPRLPGRGGPPQDPAFLPAKEGGDDAALAEVERVPVSGGPGPIAGTGPGPAEDRPSWRRLAGRVRRRLAGPS